MIFVSECLFLKEQILKRLKMEEFEKLIQELEDVQAKFERGEVSAEQVREVIKRGNKQTAAVDNLLHQLQEKLKDSEE